MKFIILPYLIKWLMVAMTATCRVRWHHKDRMLDLSESGSPFILTFWHNCSTFAPWAMSGSNIYCMVSASRDGEYVARLGALFGNRTIRGSSSKGSSAATRAVLKLLRQGQSVALTPDGPRGPKYTVQSGVPWFASATNTPILPLHIEASRQWVLNSWDKHRIPKPFSTIHIGFGELIEVDKTEFKQDPEKVAEQIQASMLENVRFLQKQAGRPLDE